MNKQCFKCNRKKPLEQFYGHKQMGDKHLGKCKACTKNDVKKRYWSKDGKKKIKEYEHRRARDPARKIKMKKYVIQKCENCGNEGYGKAWYGSGRETGDAWGDRHIPLGSVVFC